MVGGRARRSQARHAGGQPVLVGTISVEVSEHDLAAPDRRGIPHTVLNAKPEHAEREGDDRSPRPAAPARSRSRPTWPAAASTSSSAATPSTRPRSSCASSASQPGDPDYDERYAEILPEIEARVEADREKVLEAGGLFICGTERHESRRIDNQLRGRAGRQGDPGESRFFLSAEDDLVRLFAGDRIYKILDRLGTTDDEGNEEPIEAGMLTKQIEKAQKKVEEQNFLIRKRVLEYDDVMNEQRRVVYEYRDEVLEGRDMGDQAREEIADVIRRVVDEYTRRRLRRGLGRRRACSPRWPTIFPVSFGPDDLDRRSTSATSSSSCSSRTRCEALRRARGGARRGADARARALPAAADHRHTLARAPLRHGLPARGHPPARVRPDRPARRLQERGRSTSSRT